MQKMALKIQDSLFKASHFKLSLKFGVTIRRLSDTFNLKPLPFSDIPRTSRVPVLGSLPYFMKAGGQTYLHEYADNYHKKLGPIFVDKIVGNELLFLSDPEANIKVYAAEGPTPEHFVLDIWKLYLEETGQKRGIFFMDGEEWQRTRGVLNKILLRPKSMANHVQSISVVCQDLMNIWKINPPVDLEYQLYCWNIECIGDISLGKRLGFLEKLNQVDGRKKHSLKDDEFVKAVHEIFVESANLYIWPANLVKKLGLKSWKKFYSAVKIALEKGNLYVEDAYKSCKSENVEMSMKMSMLYKVIEEGSLDEETIKSVFVDLFLASADTTSHTACWALYLLGRNPDVAERARKEILSVLEKEKTLTLETLAKISYITGIIKETLRLYPTAPFLTRKVATDTNLCGYSVPAGTMVISSLCSMGRDPTNFTDPEAFKPERWFSKSTESTANIGRLERKAYIPWGLGRRSCIGKRSAEIELSLLILEALKTFEWTVEEEVNMILRMITVPSKDIKLKLKPR